MFTNMFDGNRTYFFKNNAPWLMKKLVPSERINICDIRQMSEIGADIIWKSSQCFCAQNFVTVRASTGFRPLHYYGSTYITKNEMAAPVTKIYLRSIQFRIYSQNTLCWTWLQTVICAVKTECRRRTSHQHIKSKTINAQFILYFNGDGRISPLSISTGNNNSINIGCRLTGGGHCLPRCKNADLRLIA